MDSLKGTVVLFTPHTSTGMSKDVGLCVKSEAAASKLFKVSAEDIARNRTVAAFNHLRSAAHAPEV